MSLTARIGARISGTALSGAGMVVAGIFLLVALAGWLWSPSAASLNRAVDGEAVHPLGVIGAGIGDLLHQLLGLSGFVLAVGLVCWGGLVFHRGSYGGLRWRAVAWGGCAGGAALALASLPVPSDWPLAAGLGGVAGDSLRIFILAGVGLALDSGGINGPVMIAVAGAGVGVLAALGSVALACYALAVSPLAWARQWRAAASDRRAVQPAGAPPPPEPEPAARVAMERKRGRVGKRAKRERQPDLDLHHGGVFQLPPLSLLAAAGRRGTQLGEDALEQNARMLESVLEEFGVRGAITKVRPGPVVTLYELEPAAGVKSSRVIALADDVARSMSAAAARVAVVQGRNAIGIELPNRQRETVALRELLESADYENEQVSLPLTLGKDIGGAPIIADLARMPHLLIAGTTGSGKSVAINTMILSLLYRMDPAQCRLIMIDPKMLELSAYDGIPHLLTPVVTDPRRAVSALKWVVGEMGRRYRQMSELAVRNIDSYNERTAGLAESGESLTRQFHTGFDAESGEALYESREIAPAPMPHIVVIIDEMADLMMVAGKEIEIAVQRLSQMARAAGIHLVMATQRPSVDVITGTIKANFPTRVSFQVTSKVDSRTILGETGAEQLLGRGDMLFMAGGGRISRVHGPFVSETDVEKVVRHLKRQGAPDYLAEITTEEEEAVSTDPGDGEEGLYRQAVGVVTRDGRASTSYLQRKLQLGYNRAARLIERMENDGIISAPNHAGKREVIGS